MLSLQQSDLYVNIICMYLRQEYARNMYVDSYRIIAYSLQYTYV